MKREEEKKVTAEEVDANMAMYAAARQAADEIDVNRRAMKWYYESPSVTEQYTRAALIQRKLGFNPMTDGEEHR